jgi:hypothetical protein
MVRAILDGSKTQTRRVVPAWQTISPTPPTSESGSDMAFSAVAQRHPRWGFAVFGPDEATVAGHLAASGCCPYGQVGDRLWVRETFQPIFAEGWEHGANAPDWDTGEGYAISYPATDGVIEWMDGDDNITSACKPSIHMPRWASRILLEIVSLRVERLRDITREDAAAEGVCNLSAFGNDARGVDNLKLIQPQMWPEENFGRLWESINGSGSWLANPWVWVVTFKRVVK